MLANDKQVPYEGSYKSEIAFVGEAPGAEDVTEGKPFTGHSGQKLMSIINRCGLLREDVFLANVCRFRPINDNFELLWKDSKQTVPTDLLKKEIDHLKTTLKEMPNLKVIICLGRQAMFVLSGLDGITKQRGTIIDVNTDDDLAKLRCLFTFHPSQINKVPALEYIIHLDILKAIRNKIDKLLPDREFIVYPTEEDWNYFLDKAKDKKYISVDIETRGRQITRLGMCVDIDYAISIPFQNINTNIAYDNSWVWPGFNELIKTKTIIGQNFINYDMPWLKSYGCQFTRPIFDTMIAQHIILPGLPKMLSPLSLHFLASIYTNEPYYKDEGKEVKGRLPQDKVYGEYNCKDVITTFEVAMKQMQHADLKKRFNTFKFETKLAQTTLHNLTERGVRIDTSYRDRARKRAELECKYLTLKLSEVAKKIINVASPKQVAMLLYNDLKLKPIYKKDAKGKKVITTDEAAVKTLRLNYEKYRLPELNLILKFREVEQLRKGILSTEIDKDGRIRSTFKQDEDTGRLSGGPSPFWTGQSLGVIPRDVKIRKMFIPDHEVWIHTDLSQAEAWVVYYLAGADSMIEKMKSGIKPHQIMASIIGGKSYKESGKGTKEYPLGKLFVHGRNYLMGVRTLVREAKLKLGIGISESEAKQYITAYDRLVPEVSIWHLSILEELKNNKMVLKTPLGRERKFFGRFDGTIKGSVDLMRSAIAFKPQSTVGDLNSLIMLKWEEIKTVGELILPNHDEINIDCDHINLDICLKEINEAYNYKFDIGKYKDVVIPWETEIMKNWGERI